MGITSNSLKLAKKCGFILFSKYSMHINLDRQMYMVIFVLNETIIKIYNNMYLFYQWPKRSRYFIVEKPFLTCTVFADLVGYIMQ